MRNLIGERVWLLAVVLLAAFGSELAVMLVFDVGGRWDDHSVRFAIFDAACVSLLSGPVIWHLLIQRVWRAQQTIKKLALVASNCQHGVVIADAEQRVEWVNERFENLTGFASREVIGQKAGVFLQGPRTDPDTIRHVRAKLRAGEEVAVEIINYTKDGREFWNALKVTPVFNNAGKLVQFLGTQIDISARKRIEEALRRSETKFRSLYESTYDAVMLLDENGLFVDCNPATLAVFHCASREEFCSKHPADFSPPTQPCGTDSRELAEHRIAATFAAGTQSFEWMHKRADTGANFPAEVLLSGLQLDGKPILLAVVRDITLRKLAEEQLARARESACESERRLRAIVDNMVAFVAETTPDGVLVEINETALRVGDLRRQDVIGRRLDEILPFSYSAAAQVQMRADIERARRGEIVRHDMDARVAGGDFITIDFIIVPMRDTEGRVVRLIPSGIDITDRVRAEAVLWEQTRLSELAAEVGHVLAEGSDLSSMLRQCADSLVNRLDAAFARVWLLNEAENVLELAASAGMYTHLDGPHSRVPVGTLKIGLIAQERKPHRTNSVLGDPWIGDQEWARREGMVAFSGYPLILGGRLVGVLAAFARHPFSEAEFEKMSVLADMIATGIDRCQVDIQLVRARQSADAANRAKSEFLAMMSHELRTPLNGILGMNDLLLHTELTERQRQFVEAGSTSGKALLQQINDVLDLSKIEAGKLELEVQQCNLESLVFDIVDVFTHSAAQKGLLLTCQMDVGACVSICGDENRLRQILVNLLGNAIKFTASGGVTVRVETAQRLDRQLTIRFSVTDTGIGIPADRRDRLFSPFSQVDNSTTRRFGGTGLGLSVCKQLVELMGGRIDVQSQVGVGSTFWFEVPLPLSNGDASVAARRQALAGKRVLAVDGIDKERQQIGECLRSWGCQTEQVATVQEALDAVAGAEADGVPFNVVLADCRLAQGDEYVLLSLLAEHPRLPIVGLGAGDDEKSPEYLRQLGVRRVLRDPVRPSELFDALTAVLSIADVHGSHDAAAGQPRDESHVPVSGHVLVAEDNRINQMYVVELLKYCGCTCDVVANGAEALQAVRQQRYDLVLMDCQMPEMDGFTAAREIRRWEADEALPGRLAIVALTANALQGDRQRCLEAGMDDYLSKPIDGNRLHAMLERFLRPQPEEHADTILPVQ